MIARMTTAALSMARHFMVRLRASHPGTIVGETMNALDYADFAARTLDVPLTGLNKDGSGPRVFATRTRTGQPFVRAERGKEKFGERMTGRELCTLLPDAHGLVVGDTFIEAGVAAEWRDRASADIAADREAAARRHGTVPATYEPTFDPVADQPKELSTLLYTLAKEGVEFGGVIRFVAGEHQVAGDLPEELVDVAVAARSHFHAPAAGAPVSMHLSPGNGSGDYKLNFDHEPAFDPPRPASDWVAELQAHPRTEPFIPDWWLLRLKEAGAL